MKGKVSGLLVLALLLAFCIGEAPVQEQKSQMYLVYDCIVKPSADAKLHEALKEMTTFYAKHAFPFSWSVYATDDYHYYYLIPIAGYADIEKFFKTDEEVITKAATEYQTLMDKFKDTYDSYEFQVYTYRPDLSYISAKPYHKPEEMRFVEADVWFFVPGKEREAENLCKQLFALCKKRNIRDIWYCMAGSLGVEQPGYVFVCHDKNEGEFFKHNTEMWKLLGKEGDDVFNKLLAICRKRESKREWYLPELSYSPK